MNFREGYLQALGVTDRSKLKDVRDLAHNIRQFEIELYWKRATYFWAFQLIAFAALGLLFKDGEVKNPQLLTIPASIGVVTAFAGILTARGSKFWQENWEAHVDLLEEETGERLTQVVMCRKAPQHSVSRVNESLLCLLVLGWFVVLFFSAIPQATSIFRFIPQPYQGVGIFLAVVLACVWMWRSNRTHFSGRTFHWAGTTWKPYSEEHKEKVPFIIWRDPLSERSARIPEASPRVQTDPPERVSPQEVSIVTNPEDRDLSSIAISRHPIQPS